MPVGGTFTSNITRDQLITDAYLTIGVLADGENLPSSLQTIAIRRLNAIIRELDATGKWLWAIPSTPSTITLVANTWVYTSSNGLPTNMKELVTAYYRDPQANDWQLDLLTTEGYEKIRNKLDIGDPKQVYLTEHRDVGSQTLFVWPRSGGSTSLCVLTSHKVTVLSQLPEATILPSGLKATLCTFRRCPLPVMGGPRGRWVLTSQSRRVPSAPPDPSSLPSGLKATPKMAPL